MGSLRVTCTRKAPRKFGPYRNFSSKKDRKFPKRSKIGSRVGKVKNLKFWQCHSDQSANDQPPVFRSPEHFCLKKHDLGLRFVSRKFKLTCPKIFQLGSGTPPPGHVYAKGTKKVWPLKKFLVLKRQKISKKVENRF